VKLWFRLALRNLRSGLRGFWILLTCLTLGVAAIAMIGSLASSVTRGIAEEGQVLMGGDVEFALTQREAKPDELAFMQAEGAVSRVSTMRAMAQGGGTSTLVELKAVDGNYPLYGKLDPPVASAKLAATVEPLLLSRLNLKIGDTIKLGQADVVIADTIAAEPDRIAGGLAFGPRVLVSFDTLAATGLVQPGSLVQNAYRVKLAKADLASAKAVVEEAKAKFPEAGWRARATDQAAQGADEFVSRLSLFMTLVSISALVVGGAGMANAVAAFVQRRQQTIAILKCLGADNRDAVAVSLIEILLVSLIGIAIALALGAATPFAVKQLFGSFIPLPLSDHFDAWPLVLAAVLGLLIAAAFSLWPLSRLANIKGTAAFRIAEASAGGLPPWRTIAASLALLGVAAAIVVFAFDERRITASFVGGLAAAYLVLWLLSWAVVKVASLLPRAPNLDLRQAIASLHRPGSSARPVIMALGLGLGLFVTLALTDQTISTELRSNLPDKAPAFFFMDVQGTDFAAFRQALAGQPGIEDIVNTPMLRGRISKVKGVAADEVKPKGDGGWALHGERGLTFADEVPPNSTIVSGQWWDASYAGPPLVSMSDDIAQSLDLKLGDKITVNVLGRDVEATLASTRKVNWKSLGINFVLVFNRAALEAAPHTELVTAQMKGGDEGQVLNAMAAQFPAVTSIRVKEALQTVGDLLSKRLYAVRWANLLSLGSGVLVLAGALAAGLATRSYEAVVLKTYGASRGQLLSTFVIEYAVLGLVSSVFGLFAGGLAAWFLAKFALDMAFQFSLATAAATALIAMVVTVACGLVVTWRALSAKPSFYLRNE